MKLDNNVKEIVIFYCWCSSPDYLKLIFLYERSFYFWLENNWILYLFCFITLFFSLITFLNPSVISIYFCISYYVIIIGKCRNYLSILIILVAVPLASRGDCITQSQNLNGIRNFQWKSFVLLFLSFSFDISML